VDFVSTFEGSYAAPFYPRGWDFPKIHALTSFGPEAFCDRMPFWHPDFSAVLCDDEFGGFETMNARMGYEIFAAVRDAAEARVPLALILPVGPMGMYRWAIYWSERERLSWSHVHTFNMDEWSDGEGNTMPPGDNASFQEIMETAFFTPLGVLSVPRPQRHFATRAELPRYPGLVAALREAGARLVMVYGVGRSCHIAFWEPHFAAEYESESKWRAAQYRLGAQLHPLTVEQQSFISYQSRTTPVPLRANSIGPGLFLSADWCIGGADGARGPLNWQAQPIWMTLRYGPDPWVPSSYMPTMPGRLFATSQLGGPMTLKTN
jgi:glucosamine-6-phosphate deaminase